MKILDALEHGTGAGVRIGIIDTGVADLPHLQPVLGGHYYVSDHNRKLRVVEKKIGDDDLHHGTACADIIHRYAPDAPLFDLKAMDYRSENSKYKLVAAIRFGLEQGWDILNVCVGTPEDLSDLYDITNRAIESGMMILSAIDCEGANPGFPALYPGVISVDYDMYDDPLNYDFSDGSDISGHGIYVEAHNAHGEVEAFTGTSFACPHITALAARVRQYFPDMSSDRFLEELKGVAATRQSNTPLPRFS